MFYLGRQYSCCLVMADGRTKSRAFHSEDTALDYMRELCKKHKLTIKDGYTASDVKTYVCYDNSEFHIQTPSR